MRAIVLVGGFGTRLQPLTLGTPKQMLPVVDRPMIEWVVGHLGEHGVDEAVLALGYRPDAFMAAYPDAECAGVRLRYAVEDSPLDTAGAIRFAASEAGVDERFLVVNGDVLTDLDIGALVAFHDAGRWRGNDPSPPRRRPLPLRRGAHRRRRPGHRVRREAVPGPGPVALDQRRDLRARARGAETGSLPRGRCPSSG